MTVAHTAAALLLAILLLAACGDDPASPDAPARGDALDVATLLARYAAGEVDAYASVLHDEFRFVSPDDGVPAYDRTQEIDLARSMHDGATGPGGVVLAEAALVRLAAADDWRPTDRLDRLGAHRPGARKRGYDLTLRFTIAGADPVWEVAGRITVFADTAGGAPRLLGVVDRTGDPARGDAPSWSDVRRAWAEPVAPALPGSPDLLSMRWIGAHDGCDWLRLGELLHPAFRYVGPDGETGDRADELAVFADVMAGRPGRDADSVVDLDVQDWEHVEGPWSPVGADDPHFGDVPAAVAQWLDIRIVYTTAGGEAWLVDGLVRMAAAESSRGWRLLGFVDDSADTGEPGSVGWSLIRARFR